MGAVAQELRQLLAKVREFQQMKRCRFCNKSMIAGTLNYHEMQEMESQYANTKGQEGPIGSQRVRSQMEGQRGQGPQSQQGPRGYPGVPRGHPGVTGTQGLQPGDTQGLPRD